MSKRGVIVRVAPEFKQLLDELKEEDESYKVLTRKLTKKLQRWRL